MCLGAVKISGLVELSMFYNSEATLLFPLLLVQVSLPRGESRISGKRVHMCFADCIFFS